MASKTVYPNGSVPYFDYDGTATESRLKRFQRFVCASLNHHPRFYDGSWCMGYGYVCSRCQMYADPKSAAEIQAICDAANAAQDGQITMARLCGGGPYSDRAKSRK